MNFAVLLDPLVLSVVTKIVRLLFSLKIIKDEGNIVLFPLMYVPVNLKDILLNNIYR